MLRIGLNDIYKFENEGITLVSTNTFTFVIFELNRKWLVPEEGSIAKPFPDVFRCFPDIFPTPLLLGQGT